MSSKNNMGLILLYKCLPDAPLPGSDLRALSLPTVSVLICREGSPDINLQGNKGDKDVTLITIGRCMHRSPVEVFRHCIRGYCTYIYDGIAFPVPVLLCVCASVTNHSTRQL